MPPVSIVDPAHWLPLRRRHSFSETFFGRSFFVPLPVGGARGIAPTEREDFRCDVRAPCLPTIGRQSSKCRYLATYRKRPKSGWENPVVFLCGCTIPIPRIRDTRRLVSTVLRSLLRVGDQHITRDMIKNACGCAANDALLQLRAGQRAHDNQAGTLLANEGGQDLVGAAGNQV